MKRCFIHFGMAKTGSSSIQKTFYNIGRRGDFAYLQAGSMNAARALASAFMADPHNFRPLKRRGFEIDDIEEHRREIRAILDTQLRAKVTTFLLSSEMLAGFDDVTLTTMRDWLRERVDQVQLVGYVRPIYGYLESMFAQSFKNGNSSFDVERRYPDFEERFSRLESVFGRENIAYRIFDPAWLRNGCVVQDLAQFMGVDISGKEVQRVNESLSREAVGLLYAYRKWSTGYGDGAKAVAENAWLVRQLGELQGSKLRLDPTLVAPVLESHQQDLQWMEARLGQPLSLVPDRSDETGLVGSSENLLEFSEATLAWLAEQAKSDEEQTRLVMRGRRAAIVRAMDSLRPPPEKGRRRAAAA